MSESKQAEPHAMEQPPVDEKGESHDHERGEKDTILDRIGFKTAWMLFGCLIIEIAAVGFLAFLWYGTVNNKNWHNIVARNWVTRSVTLTSLALRIAMAVQGATCLSMLAAITLEKLSVPLENVAEISLMRSGNKTDLVSVVLNYLMPLYPLVRHGSKADRRYGVFAFISTLIVLITLIVSQFSSTFLLSDVKAQAIPGRNSSSMIAYDYEFTDSPDNKASIYGSGWWKGGSDNSKRYGYTYPLMSATSYWNQRTPSSWPVFAEYSEPPFQAKNVDDTGVSLRAFLPFATSERRGNLKDYTGKALVLDSRVTCQKPKTKNIKWGGGDVVIGNHDFQDSSYGSVSGIVSPTVKTPNMIMDVGDEYEFDCAMATDYDTAKIPWSVCQLATWQNLYDPARPKLYSPPLYGLKSMLKAANGKNQTGAAFLILGSATNSLSKKMPNPTEKDDTFVHLDVAGDPDNQSTDRGVDVSMTLCFASFDVADRYIEAYSDFNRTEPTSLWNVDASTLDVSDVIKQLDTGYSKSNSKVPTPEERGILRMKPRSDWTEAQTKMDVIDGPDQLQYVPNLKWTKPKGTKGFDVNMVPYVIAAMGIYGGAPHLEGSLESGTGNNSWTAMMFPGLPTANAGGTSYSWSERITTTPDWLTNLFGPLLETTRPAVALQAALTSIAGMGYYDRVNQYTKTAKVWHTFFESHESAGGPNGQKRTKLPGGFIAVLVILLIHLIMLTIILVRFLMLSHLTRIGDGWQAIAQIALSERSRPVLEQSAVTGGKSAVSSAVDPQTGQKLQKERIGLRKQGGMSKMVTM